MKLRTQKIISTGGLIISLVAYVITIQTMTSLHSISSELMIHMQRIATVLLMCGIVFTIWTYYAVIAVSHFNETTKGLLLSVATLFVIVLDFECYFLHKEESNAVGYRWSYKLWDSRYLAAHRTKFYIINAKGEKERADLREPLPDSTDKRKKILFIGDSFTFGFGIENTSLTFPALIENKFNKQYACVNLGDGGADTYKEYSTLLTYDSSLTTKPVAVVWQYLGNDIDSNDEGPDLYENVVSKSKWIQFGKTFFQGKSFLLDYIYWQFFMGNEKGVFGTYTDFLKRLFNETSTSNDCTNPYCKHLQPLKKAAAYYHEKNIPFIVVVYPFLWDSDFEFSKELYTHRLSNDFKQYGIDVINLTPVIEKIPVNKRTVNSHDPHPSVSVSKLTADTIATFLKKQYNL